jgi:hypothetical protein
MMEKRDGQSRKTLMAEDATPLVEVLLAIFDAARAYLRPDGIGKEFIAQVLQATDNPWIIAALATHGHSVAPQLLQRSHPPASRTVRVSGSRSTVTSAERLQFAHAPPAEPCSSIC